MHLYLVRHAQTRPEQGRPPHEWPLSDEGHRQAEAVAALPFWPSVRVIYSSPEAKALDTVRPAAARHGVPVIEEQDLRELARPAGLIPDYQGAVAECLAYPLQSRRGWEAAAHAQARITAVVRRVAGGALVHDGTLREDDAAVLVGHGLLFALLLAGLEGRHAPTVAEWRAIPMPGWAVLEVAGPESPRPRLIQPFRAI